MITTERARLESLSIFDLLYEAVEVWGLEVIDSFGALTQHDMIESILGRVEALEKAGAL